MKFLPDSIFLIQFQRRVIQYSAVSRLHPGRSPICFPVTRDKVSNVDDVSGQAAAQELPAAH